MKKKVLFFTAHASHQKQSGVTLFVVIIFVLLSMLLALWASRTSIFGEMVVGNDADYQRAYEAAQALLLDAELDIRGERSDGRACAYGGLPSGSAATICRTGNTLKIPIETQDLPLFLADLENEPTRCKDGLCVKRVGRQDFWNTTSKVPTSLAAGEKRLSDLAVNRVGARYGQYTGAKSGDAANPANLILADVSSATAGGWYWIEVMPYIESKSKVIANAAANQLDLSGIEPNAVFRITAIAYGRKPETKVVLQQSYAIPKEKN